MWAKPIKLNWFWRIVLEGVEFAGPLGLGCLSIYLLDDGLPKWILWAVIGISAVSFLAHVFRIFCRIWGHPARKLVYCEMEIIALEVFRAHPEYMSGPNHHHRATLFMAKKKLFKWRYTHKLVPCVRWPKDGRKPQRKFLVHEHETEKCQGVAGIVFANGSAVTEELPNLREGPIQPVDLEKRIERYAQMTNDDKTKVEREKYYARVIGGFTIPNISGGRWGVLIFDSPDPTAITHGVLEDVENPTVNRALQVLPTIVDKEIA
jgi:hypothetical protein